MQYGYGRTVESVRRHTMHNDKKKCDCFSAFLLRLFNVVCCLLFLLSAADAQTLAINTFGAPPLSNAHRNGFHDLMTIEIFRRLGHEVVIPRLPAERALLNANKGIDDGDLPRIAGLESLYPNLIMVPESIMDYNFVAFTRNADIKSSGWKGLQPYNVGIITGWKILEKNVVGVHSLVKVHNQKQLFTLLKLDRVDVVVYEQWQGLRAARELGITDLQILQPPLAKRKMYMYLHKKNAGLVTDAAAALRDMKGDGTYAAIVKQTLDLDSAVGTAESRLEQLQRAASGALTR